MNHQQLDIKILEYLDGECTEGECREIEAWIEESEEHRLYFENFRRGYLRIHAACRSQLISDIEFSRFRRKLGRKINFRVIWQVAASVVVLLGVGLFWLRPEEQQVLEAFVIESDSLILPGKSKATLFLASGTAVTIADRNQELREEDGTSIVVENGKVAYSGSHKSADAVKPLNNRLVIPRGGEFVLVLEDGTKVWLNSRSELVYPANFIGDRREVSLKGEAYFQVGKDTQRPFIVHVDDLQIRAYGTEFNVNSQVKGKIETVLVSGSVGVKQKNEEIRLLPNEKAEYIEGCEDINVEKVDVAAYIAWKDGNFIFQHETLENIMSKLSLWYDVEVSFLQDELKGIRLSGDMKRYDEIQDMLYFFEKTSRIRFIIRDRTIVVAPK